MTNTTLINVYILSLGCAKNQVDSEVMSGALDSAGFRLTNDPQAAQVIIINTCGFIEAAKKESIEAILDLAAWKEQGSCRLLVAVGCMAEKYGDEMRDALPELDAVMGSRDYAAIAALVADKLRLPAPAPAEAQRLLPPGTATAYLKIAEGCDNRCTYCLIPQLRGPYISRAQQDILAEAENLLSQGVQELVLIAQDTTRYGLDLYGEARLPQLLEALAALPFAMIRLLYAYPDMISDELIAVMAAHDNICHYLDMPIQHGSDRVLRAMGRHSDRAQILSAVARLRAAMPDIALRTTVMVGFPGETEEDFDQLLTLMQEARFMWLGGFMFSPEDDTPAARLPQQVDEETKQQRLDEVMQLAAAITQRELAAFDARTLSVLAEGPAEDADEGVMCGRSQYQAPDVDGAVLFRASEPIQAGKLYPVQITDRDIYDVWGEVK